MSLPVSCTQKRLFCRKKFNSAGPVAFVLALASVAMGCRVDNKVDLVSTRRDRSAHVMSVRVSLGFGNDFPSLATRMTAPGISRPPGSFTVPSNALVAAASALPEARVNANKTQRILLKMSGMIVCYSCGEKGKATEFLL